MENLLIPLLHLRNETGSSPRWTNSWPSATTSNPGRPRSARSGPVFTKSALEALTTAESPAEFDAAWKRVLDNFDVLIDSAEKLTGLRSALLELAVTSRLVTPVL